MFISKKVVSLPYLNLSYKLILVKRTVSFILSLLILLIAFQQTLLIVHYHLNRDFIEKAYCINKDKKEMDCHGKCHLKKNIEDTSHTSDKLLNLKDIDIVLQQPFSFETAIVHTLEEIPPFFFKEQLLIHKIVKKQMRPPISSITYLC